MSAVTTPTVLPHAPGPPTSLFLGTIRKVERDSLGFYTGMAREYGDVVRLGALSGRARWYLVAHPQGVEHVLRTNSRNYTKGVFARPLKLMVGEGLVTSEGAYWLRQRRLAQPAFHKRRIAALADGMAAATQDMLREWDERHAGGRAFDAANEMMRLTLRIVGRALFSADLGGRVGAFGPALTETLEYVNRRSFRLFALPERIPTPRNRRFVRARAELDRVAYDLIEARRRSGEDAGDLLSMLLLARDEETGERMSDAQLRDEVMTILLAGHETGAVAMSWTWYLLSRHPEQERRLHEELDAALGGRTPTFEDLPRLSYAKMVVEEAMRLYPPAWGIARQAREEDEIGGYRIPAGSPIAILPWVTHRHPALWERPEAFDPERFGPERSAGRPPYAYFPFGGGPRQCIGSAFALMEAQLILAGVAQRYRLRLAPGRRVEPEPLVTLRPRGGMWMTLEAR